MRMEQLNSWVEIYVTIVDSTAFGNTFNRYELPSLRSGQLRLQGSPNQRYTQVGPTNSRVGRQF